jgi:hypothetical protein
MAFDVAQRLTDCTRDPGALLFIRLPMSRRQECSFDGLAGLLDCEPLAVNN